LKYSVVCYCLSPVALSREVLVIQREIIAQCQSSHYQTAYSNLFD